MNALFHCPPLFLLRAWIFVRGFIVPALLLTAVLSVLFHGLLEARHSSSIASASFSHVSNHESQDKPALPLDNTSAPKHLDDLMSTALPVALMLTHLAYLLLMARHLIYRYPVDRPRFLMALVLTVIVVAYLAQAITPSAVPDLDSLTPSAPYILFSIAYFMLWIHGAHELRSESSPFPRAKARLYYFGSVDGFFAISFLISALTFPIANALRRSVPTFGILLGNLLSDASGVDYHFSSLNFLTAKDCLIFISLVAYILNNKVMDHVTAAYRNDTYARYLSYVTVVSAPADDLSFIVRRLGQRSKWLDYNAGTAQRTAEILRLLYPSPTSPVTQLILYDHEPEFPDLIEQSTMDALRKFVSEVKTQRSTSNPDLAILLREADVVILSHNLYEISNAVHILTSLASLRDDAVLLVRVTGLTGLFRPISMTFSRRAYRPSSRHIIPEASIADLARRYSFQIDRVTTISQVYRLGQLGAERALARWCDVAYGDSIGHVVSDYLKALSVAGVSDLRNDDHLYFMSRKAAEPR